jgi:hypothetical protein
MNHNIYDVKVWTEFVWLRVMNFRVPKKARNLMTSWVTVSFSRTALLAIVYVYWIHLTQDRDQWRSLFNIVMNL